jgi:predicted membrane-bound mannosyltransferase
MFFQLLLHSPTATVSLKELATNVQDGPAEGDWSWHHLIAVTTRVTLFILFNFYTLILFYYFSRASTVRLSAPPLPSASKSSVSDAWHNIVASTGGRPSSTCPLYGYELRSIVDLAIAVHGYYSTFLHEIPRTIQTVKQFTVIRVKGDKHGCRQGEAASQVLWRNKKLNRKEVFPI